MSTKKRPTTPTQAKPHIAISSKRGATVIGQATALAAYVHKDHDRKACRPDDATVPYLTHLLGAASLVAESPAAGAEHVAAALLHDSVEDRATRLFKPERIDWSERKVGVEIQLARRLRTVFDDRKVAERVAHLIMCATEDRSGHTSQDWHTRKAAYRDALAHETLDQALVSLADNVHNTRALISDLQEFGPEVWGCFNASAQDRIDHLRAVLAIAQERFGGDVLTAHLTNDVNVLIDLATAQGSYVEP